MIICNKVNPKETTDEQIFWALFEHFFLTWAFDVLIFDEHSMCSLWAAQFAQFSLSKLIAHNWAAKIAHKKDWGQDILKKSYEQMSCEINDHKHEHILMLIFRKMSKS